MDMAIKGIPDKYRAEIWMIYSGTCVHTYVHTYVHTVYDCVASVWKQVT